MTKQEYIKITLILDATYQKFPSFINSLKNQDVLNTQYMLLKDLDYESLSNATLTWCQTEKFPPSIAELREQCYQNTTNSITVDQAWGYFLKAVQDYNYNNEETIYKRLGVIDNKLEQVARNFGIRNIAMSDIDNSMADRAHFIKLFNIVEVREKRTGMISDSVKEAIRIGMRNNIKQIGGLK